MNVRWLSHSRALLRSAVFLSILSIYVSITYEPGLVPAVDALEAHAEWDVSAFYSVAKEHPGWISKGEEFSNFVRRQAEACGVTSSISRPALGSVPGRGSGPLGRDLFATSTTLSRYIAELDKALDRRPTICVPDSVELEGRLSEVFRAVSSFNPNVSECSFSSFGQDSSSITLFIDFLPSVSVAKIEGLIPAYIEVRRFEDRDYWRAVTKFTVRADRFEITPSFKQWCSSTRQSVPVSKNGEVDTEILKELEFLVGSQEPDAALRFARDQASKSSDTFNLFSVPIDFSKHSWVVLLTIVVLQVYALVYLWVVKPEESDPYLSSEIAWIALRREWLFRLLFCIELAIPALATIAVTSRLHAVWGVAIAVVSVVCSALYGYRVNGVVLGEVALEQIQEK